jgi:hypothetical protein
MVRKHQTSDAQLRIGESRASGFDALHRPGTTVLLGLAITSTHLALVADRAEMLVDAKPDQDEFRGDARKHDADARDEASSR